jgi:hypothetical protein
MYVAYFLQNRLVAKQCWCLRLIFYVESFGEQTFLVSTYVGYFAQNHLVALFVYRGIG